MLNICQAEPTPTCQSVDPAPLARRSPWLSHVAKRTDMVENKACRLLLGWICRRSASRRTDSGTPCRSCRWWRRRSASPCCCAPEPTARWNCREEAQNKNPDFTFYYQELKDQQRKQSSFIHKINNHHRSDHQRNSTRQSKNKTSYYM